MIGQLLRFAGVGALATLTHVAVALLAAGALGATPLLANLAGFAVAVGVSYLGHAFVTFRARGHRTQAPRFVALSLAGLGLSSGITALVCTGLGGSLLAAQGLAAVAVPVLSFLGARSWAFAPPGPGGGA